MSHNQDTVCVHAGLEPEPITGAVIPPLFLTSTYVQKEPGVHSGFDYSRADNPTRQTLELALAQLEGAQHALVFGSGLAAEHALIQTFLKPGDTVFVCDDVYGGSGRLFRKFFEPLGIHFQFLDLTQESTISLLKSTKPQMLWIETPSNPTMKVIDIAKLCSAARSIGAISVLDNTFASPYLQSPLRLGADFVVHSATKYLGGHSDIIAGAVMLNSEEWFQKLKFTQFAAGAILSPFDCYLLLRSLKTLGIRMQRHSSNALFLAQKLSGHREISEVFYPGLSGHPGFEVAKAQMSKGFGGMISIRLKGDYGRVKNFLSKLKLFQLAESLGGVESLVNHPEKMTHASVPEALRQKLGIDSQLLRLSVGIEHQEDLLEDLTQALHF